MQFQAIVMGRGLRTLCSIRDALLALPLILDQLAELVTAERTGCVLAARTLLSAESAECAIGTPLHGFDARVHNMTSDTDRVVLLASGLKKVHTGVNDRLNKLTYGVAEAHLLAPPPCTCFAAEREQPVVGGHK